MICSVDLGGTKVKIGLFDAERPHILCDTQTFSSADFASFSDLISAFLQPRRPPLLAMAVGVAGPTTATYGEVTNLGWRLHADDLSRQIACPNVMFLNDLEAHAWGIAAVGPDGLKVIRAGTRKVGNQALIAAGTGLGESILFWNGSEHIPRASEGGHCSFAPMDARDVELLQYLWRSHAVVSWERVVSGSFGFRHLYQFLLSKPDWAAQVRIPIDTAADFGPQIYAAARARDPVATEVVRWFMRLYGAEAGNLALKAWALGGLYISGGIATKLQEFMRDGDFVAGFANKGRFQKILDEIPITLVTDVDCALLGAARYAAHHLRQR